MNSFSSYKKNELLDIARALGLKVSLRMKKSDIIAYIREKNSSGQKTIKINVQKENKMLTSSKKQQKKRISKSQSHNPLEGIHPHGDRRVTCLAQSEKDFLIIWNADKNINGETKAWKVSNKNSLDILLPPYARSLFLEKEQMINQVLSISRILHNNQSILYATHENGSLDHYVNLEDLSKSQLNDLYMNHFKSYRDNCFSSENNIK